LVGASNKKVGNVECGGEWIMTSTNENIENIYFTKNIINYPLTLSATTITASPGQTVYIQQNGSYIQYQINSTTGSWTNITFPVTIINSNPSIQRVTVSLATNITLTAANQYFIIGSNLITVDGSIYTVTIGSSVTDYPGFVQNLSYSGISVSNINMKCTTSTLAGNGGWVGQSGTINTNFYKCSSDGIIGQTGTIFTGGGIVGSSTSYVTVENCWSSGQITGYDVNRGSGGIVGLSCVNAIISNCYSTGNIGLFGGGILGSFANGFLIDHCYSLG